MITFAVLRNFICLFFLTKFLKIKCRINLSRWATLAHWRSYNNFLNLWNLHWVWLYFYCNSFWVWMFLDYGIARNTRVLGFEVVTLNPIMHCVTWINKNKFKLNHKLKQTFSFTYRYILVVYISVTGRIISKCTHNTTITKHGKSLHDLLT